MGFTISEIKLYYTLIAGHSHLCPGITASASPFWWLILLRNSAASSSELLFGTPKRRLTIFRLFVTCRWFSFSHSAILVTRVVALLCHNGEQRGLRGFLQSFCACAALHSLPAALLLLLFPSPVSPLPSVTVLSFTCPAAILSTTRPPWQLHSTSCT